MASYLNSALQLYILLIAMYYFGCNGQSITCTNSTLSGFVLQQVTVKCELNSRTLLENETAVWSYPNGSEIGRCQMKSKCVLLINVSDIELTHVNHTFMLYKDIHDDRESLSYIFSILSLGHTGPNSVLKGTVGMEGQQTANDKDRNVSSAWIMSTIDHSIFTSTPINTGPPVIIWQQIYTYLKYGVQMLVITLATCIVAFLLLAARTFLKCTNHRRESWSVRWHNQVVGHAEDVTTIEVAASTLTQSNRDLGAATLGRHCQCSRRSSATNADSLVEKPPLPPRDSIGLPVPDQVNRNCCTGVSGDLAATLQVIEGDSSGRPAICGLDDESGPREGLVTNPQPSTEIPHRKRCASELLYYSVEDLVDERIKKDPREELFKSEEYQVLSARAVKKSE